MGGPGGEEEMVCGRGRQRKQKEKGEEKCKAEGRRQVIKAAI